MPVITKAMNLSKPLMLATKGKQGLKGHASGNTWVHDGRLPHGTSKNSNLIYKHIFVIWCTKTYLKHVQTMKIFDSASKDTEIYLITVCVKISTLFAFFSRNNTKRTITTVNNETFYKRSGVSRRNLGVFTFIPHVATVICPTARYNWSL